MISKGRGGVGTANTVPKFTGSVTIGNSSRTDTGTIVTESLPVTVANVANALNTGNYTFNVMSGVTDGVTAVGHLLDTTNNLTTATAKILAIRNAGVDKITVFGNGDTTIVGAMTASNFKQINYSLAAPTNAGDATEFSTVTNSNFSSNVEIWFTIHSSGYAQSKRYIIPVEYDATGGLWHKCLPISSTGVYTGANDSEIDVKISFQVATFRIRRISGVVAGAASITLAIGGDMAGTTVASASATYIGQVVTVNYAPTSLTMLKGKTGINNDLPAAFLHILGTTEQLRAGYDASNYVSATINSTGLLTLNAVGTAPKFALTGGNVGIGVTTPQATLHVTGDIGQYSSSGASAGSPIGSSLYLGDANYPNASYYNSAPGISAVYEAAQNLASSLGFYTFNGAPNSRTERVRIIGATGNVGIGVVAPTALLHLKAGTATASTAPLKLTSGSLNATSEAGAVEFLTDDFYGTISTAAARKKFVLDDGTALTAGRVPFATTNGRLTDDLDMTFVTDTLTVTKIKSAYSAISTGAAAIAGNVTLVGGTVTVSTTKATATCIVMLTRKTSGGTIGTAITYTLNAGVSFTINSDNILDTSTFSWAIVETY